MSAAAHLIKDCFTFRDVLRRLFADTLSIQGSKLLTLREMLMESCEQRHHITDERAQRHQQAEQVSTYYIEVALCVCVVKTDTLQSIMMIRSLLCIV